MMDKLYRNKSTALIGGVCSGLTDYLDIDLSVLRIISLILLFATGGCAFFIYLISWLIIPMKTKKR
jgi:phage shock protein PspC (stress-responsive transcriptional regulator)